MKTKKLTESYTTVRADLLALPLVDGAPHDEAYRSVDEALEGALTRIAREEGFTRRRGGLLLVHTHGRIGPARVFLVGLGKTSDLDEPAARKFAHLAVRAARRRRAARVALAWPFAGDLSRQEGDVEDLVLGTELGGYRFDRHKSSAAEDENGNGNGGDAGAKDTVQELDILAPRGARRRLTGAVFDDAVRRGQARARGVTFAQDPAHEPANILSPSELAARARAIAEESALLEIDVLDRAAIEELGMGLLLAVTRGATEPPAFIHMRYTPPEELRSADGRRIALVGKGITFDSGGLDIKTRGHMQDMKCDMGGAATVLGVMAALDVLRPPVEVHAVVPAAENMTGGAAYRPGDVLRSMNGKTVEVLNTDAEGRLALADAITFARGLEVDEIIDLATLTGACAVALGERTAGLFSNRRATADRLLRASRVAGESLWELPLDRHMKHEMRSTVADLKNIGGRYGGAIHGALFLDAFVGDTPWAHIDIAGPAYTARAHGTTPRGATGYGVLTLLAYLARG